MATRVLPFTVVVPPDTLSTAPINVPLNLDGWDIERIDLEVPAGSSGLMGFQLYNNGVGFIPYGINQWIVWDEVRESYYLEDQPNAGGWECVAYNDGNYAHSVTLRFHVSPASVADAVPVTQALTVVTSDITTEPVNL